MNSADNNDSNDNTPNNDPDQVGTFSCYVSPRIQALAAANARQGQVTISHGKLKEFLGLAKLDPETILSRKRGFGLLLTVKTPKGAEIPLVMADTHSIWFSHQRDDNAKKLVNYMISKGGGELPLLSVEGVNLSVSKQKVVTAEQMEDCPV